MALKYAEGFDDDATDYRTTTFDTTVSTAWGTDGRRGARIGESTKSLFRSRIIPIDSGGENSIWWHFRLYLVDVSSGQSMVWMNQETGDTQFVFAKSSGGQFHVTNYVSGSNSAAFGEAIFNKWYEVFIEKVYHASTGTFKLWMNGRLEVDESGLNTGTIPTHTDIVSGGYLPTQINDGYLMDVVVGDGSDSPSAAFPYSLNAHTLLPDGNGNSSVLVGSDADSTDNYLLVDNPNPNEAEFVGSAVEGDKDTYTMEDLPSASEDIIGVIAEQIAAKADQGTKFMRPVIRTVSTDYVGDSYALAQSYALDWHAWDLNPNTSLAWTGTEVNAIEVGAEVRDS